MANTIEILFEDDALVVVAKPAGVPTIPARPGKKPRPDSIIEQLRREPPLRLVHRLDAGTSGVLVLAKTLEAQRVLSAQFRERRVQKQYLALVRGHLVRDRGKINARLARHAQDPTRVVVRPRGKPAITCWKLLQQYPGVALVRCFPLTGRQHQIRVHLKHAGYPLLVDELYGSGRPFLLSEVKAGYQHSTKREERPLLGRLSLHAEALSLSHPLTGHQMTFVAAVPKDFRASVAQLAKLAGLVPPAMGARDEEELARPRRGVVAVLERDARLLLVRRSPDVVAGGWWCFPGGAIEEGESPEQAIVREMREELGLDIEPVQPVWEWRRPADNLHLQWWRVRSVDAEQSPRPNPDEVADARWLELPEILALERLLPGNREFLEQYRGPDQAKST